MAKKPIHHMDFPTLVEANKEVVLLTREPHEYTQADGEKLEELLQEVASRADNQDFEEAVPEKASLLVFKIASGQHFHAGNKRTALVAGLVFLNKNGFKIKINDPDFVSTVDKVGMAAASLDDLNAAMRRLMTKSAVERKGWDNALKQTVEANKKFLTDLGS
ncbi:MAG: Fic family protein [Thaumarchaeota archaeon]|nr:Fic family protein [Nitrososphaerota archaeon]